MGKDDVRGEPDLAREILNYFLRHPRAADDLEGVARWRLMEERVRRTIQQADEAVQWLVTNGFLEEIVTPGGRVFRLREDNRENAEHFLSRK